MSWNDDLALLNSAVIDTDHGLGQLATLTNGATVRGLLTTDTETNWGYGAELTDALEAQAQTAYTLETTDATTHAAQLSIGAKITVDATTYRIAEPPKADGFGFSRIALMREQDQDTDATAATQRWR